MFKHLQDSIHIGLSTQRIHRKFLPKQSLLDSSYSLAENLFAPHSV